MANKLTMTRLVEVLRMHITDELLNKITSELRAKGHKDLADRFEIAVRETKR